MNVVVPLKGWVPDPSQDFGARLALVRQHKGWNRKQAAETCAIDPATWNGWETRGVRPRGFAEECAKISAATGADYFWLMTGTTPPPAEPHVTDGYLAPSRRLLALVA
jgi:hypothetical protein